jgi:hypothetical protein
MLGPPVASDSVSGLRGVPTPRRGFRIGRCGRRPTVGEKLRQTSLRLAQGYCDSLPPFSPRFVSFAWRYHCCDSGSSPAAPVAGPWISLEASLRSGDG